MLTDTHAHLYWDSFKDDLNQVVRRAVEAGVSYIINIGVDVETSKKALDQVKNYKWHRGLQVYSTIGIHPHENNVSIHEDIGKLEGIYQSGSDKIVAIGECGLDYKDIDEKTKNLQRQLFQAQIDLAKSKNLPLIVHCREAWDEVLEMTKDYLGIYHCYSGLPPTTNYILQATNFLVSIACNITYPKNEYLHEAIKLLPLDRIVLETDCPFLPPQSKRGTRNEPANIKAIAHLLADLKGISLEEVAKQTTENAKKIFNIT